LIVSYLPEPEKHPLWPGIQELLKPAAEYGEIPVFGDGECLWIAFDGPTVFAAGTTLLWNDGEAEIRLCGGVRHREWVREALSLVEQWARSAGASRLTMRGRKGWARYVRAFGWGLRGIEDGKQLYEKVL
jgi:hypothetical protein